LLPQRDVLPHFRATVLPRAIQRAAGEAGSGQARTHSRPMRKRVGGLRVCHGSPGGIGTTHLNGRESLFWPCEISLKTNCLGVVLSGFSICLRCRYSQCQMQGAGSATNPCFRLPSRGALVNGLSVHHGLQSFNVLYFIQRTGEEIFRDHHEICEFPGLDRPLGLLLK
jgi:hypothetical protein